MKTSYYNLNVSKIIPGVLRDLSADPSKRFSWAEIAYFQQWLRNKGEKKRGVRFKFCCPSRWQVDATASEQEMLRTLIANNQWEFIDGGVVQHDQVKEEEEKMMTKIVTLG